MFQPNTPSRGSPTASRHWLFLPAAFLLILPAAPAHAATYYVATNGSDSNAGTQGAPFKNVQKAVGVVRAGDTVIIKPGKHAPFDLRNINGAAAAPITFQGEPGAVIDQFFGNNTNHRRNIEFYGSSYITIDGLELTDTYNGPPPNSCAGSNSGIRGGGIKINKLNGSLPHHIIFKNLHIHGTGGGGIGGTGNYIQFINNYVHNNGKAGQEAYGTYLKGRYNVISGNRFHNHTGNGIRVGNDESVAGTSELFVDGIIENNVIYNNGGSWLHPHGVYGSPEFSCVTVKGGAGIVVWHGSGNIIRNNVVYGNYGHGIRVNENFAVNRNPNLVYNNTVYKNGYEGIVAVNREGVNTVIKNNISYLSGKENIAGGIPSDNITIDPKFVNPGSGDFGLQAGSPAIDKGVTLAEVKTDFTGKARPDGAAYDIGAFEGAGSRADALPGVGAGLPAGAGGGGSAISDPFGLGHCLK